MLKMTQNATLAAVLLLSLALAFAGCGGGSEALPPTQPPPSNPTAVLSSLSPASGIVGGSGFTLTLNGSNFTSSPNVEWNGLFVPTLFVSSQQLTATISASLITSAGPVSVTAANSNSNRSNVLQFLVNNPAPQISSISPNDAVAGAAPLLLTVGGSNFISGAIVLLNGSPQSTTSQTATQLLATISASDLADARSISVTVKNTDPTVGPSNQLAFTITPFTSNPAPAITSLSDVSAFAGWPGFPLTVYGNGFVAGTILQWNGLNQPTTVLNATSLEAGIPASDLITPATAQVGVVNSSPGGGTSSNLGFIITPVAAGALGVIERSSIANDLTEGDAASEQASISGDGRFVAFSSDATTLVPGDTNGFTDVFLRDTCLGAPAGCLPSVTRVSVSTAGQQADGFSSSPATSANGRYVAFVSDADNLVPGDTNQFPDVFVRDTCFGAPSGCVASTVRVSLNNDGTQILLENGEPAISADGRFVAFGSGMDDFYYGPSFNVFVRDTCAGAPAGCTSSTTLISALPNGTASNFDCESPAISSDGRFVAFQTADKMTSDDTNQVGDIFLRDTCVGALAGCTPSTIRVSQGEPGAEGANGVDLATSISGAGRFVTFVALASGGLPAAVFVRDTCIGAPAGCSASTTRVSMASGGAAGNGDSRGGSLSSDGRYIAFEADATNLVPGDTNGATDIFVRDTCLGAPAGCVSSTIRVSVTLGATQSNGGNVAPVITADGRFVAFISSASNLALGDTNKFNDVLLSVTGFNP
jgi:trimeric autotransporter adhesin